MTTKHYRWNCPNDKHPGVLAPGRLRKIDVRRYCLSCSQSKGVLVERTCPVLDQRRAAHKDNRQRKSKTRKRAQQQRQERKFLVAGWDIREEIHAIESLPVVASAYTKLERKPVTVEVRQRRKGNYTTGRAWSRRCRVVLTFPTACPRSKAAVLMAHEIAHVAVADAEHHGPAWRDMFLTILRDRYDFDVAEWPYVTNSQKRVDHRIVHRLFEKMLAEQWKEKSK